MVIQSSTSKSGTTSSERNDNQLDAQVSESMHSPRTWSNIAIILWLVVIGMGVFFLPLYAFAATVREDATNLEIDLASVRALLTVVPTARPEIQRLLTPLAQTQAQTNQINLVYPTLIAPRPNLPVIMTTIGNFNSNEIMLTALTLENNRITLNGRATREEQVIGYVHALEQSNLFARVLLQSAQISPTAAPTAALTPSPKRANESPTATLLTSMPMRFVISLELKAVAP